MSSNLRREITKLTEVQKKMLKPHIRKPEISPEMKAVSGRTTWKTAPKQQRPHWPLLMSLLCWRSEDGYRKRSPLLSRFYTTA